jgi:hypothetical protein
MPGLKETLNDERYACKRGFNPLGRIQNEEGTGRSKAEFGVGAMSTNRPTGISALVHEPLAEGYQVTEDPQYPA